MNISENKKQEIFDAFRNNTNDVNLNDFDIEIVKESFFEFAEELTKKEYYQLEEDLAKVGIRDYELMNETRTKKFNDLFAEYMEQYNKKDMKQENLEVSDFVGKKYVSEYTINGNKYKSIITVLAQNYGLLEIKREVFQNGKEFKTIEKAIKLSRIREGLKTGFYKEYTEPKQEVKTSEAEKIDFINIYLEHEGTKLYMYNGVLFRQILITGSAHTEATKKEDIKYIIDQLYNYYQK